MVGARVALKSVLRPLVVPMCRSVAPANQRLPSARDYRLGRIEPPEDRFHGVVQVGCLMSLVRRVTLDEEWGPAIGVTLDLDLLLRLGLDEPEVVVISRVLHGEPLDRDGGKASAQLSEHILDRRRGILFSHDRSVPPADERPNAPLAITRVTAAMTRGSPA